MSSGCLLEDPLHDVSLAQDRGVERESYVRTAAEARAWVEEVLAAMSAEGYGDGDRYAVRLALNEALSNALVHGNRCDTRRQVCCRYGVKAVGVWAEVEDEGEGFDPESIPDPTLPENLYRPHGRGLALIGHLTTYVRFNERGNAVLMARARTQ